MNCPKCGADMKEDTLYCETCGEDIHIVPDFEPELEFSLSNTLNQIKEDVNEEIGTILEEESFKKNNPKKRSSFFIISIVGGGIVCALVIIGVILAYQYNSYDYQIQKAVSCTAVNQYDKAVRHYNRAIEISDTNIENYFALAEVYYMKKNKVEYEFFLREIINNPRTNEEQLERAYKKIITIYKDRGEFDTINEMLWESNDEEIQSTYQAYLAKPPHFSYEEGTYDKIVPLKLSSSVAGKIYYTLDGSEPNENSMLYTAPIFLENDEYIIKAYFENQYGVCSEVVTKKYLVTFEPASAPVLNVTSGEYTVPTYIEPIDDKEEDLYYTTDGSDPNHNSTLYTGPIPMPIGSSYFKFAYVKEDGSIGDITECLFLLTLDANITPSNGEQIIVDHMITIGKILNSAGYVSDTSSVQYKYQCLYAFTIPDTGDFYMIAEINIDEDKISARTGSYYVVDIHSGEYFKLQKDDKNNYNLIELE